LTYSTNVGFAPWGGGWGWGMAPHWSVNSNLSEVRAEQAQAVKNSAKQVEEIRKQIEVYKRFKNLIERWIALAIEHSQVKMKQ